MSVMRALAMGGAVSVEASGYRYGRDFHHLNNRHVPVATLAQPRFFVNPFCRLETLSSEEA
jgi:hypothetical protein